MQEKDSAYKDILKGTAMFGGVQVFNIFIALCRSKIVALFLGPGGMGISALFTSTVNIIIQIAGLGLNLAIVKEIAATNEDISRLKNVTTVARRWLLFAATLGCIIPIVLSHFLSRITFGSDKYIGSFICLSAMVFFSILASGETALLQGGRKLQSMAIATLIGAVCGIIFGLPLYWLYHENGIVPALILSALVLYVANIYFSAKAFPFKKSSLSIKETLAGGKKMIQLGIALMFASVIGAIIIYIINAYISYKGGVKDVGYFQAASSITNQYVGLIFSAMAVDYLPRLAGIKNSKDLNDTVNQQAEIILLIVAPLIMILIVTTPLVVRLLLTKDFFVIIPVLRWMALGMLFKAVSFTLGYISFAKGDRKTFFLYEAIYTGALSLLLNVLGYTFAGLKGLGISFLISYLLYLLIIYRVALRKYEVRFSKHFLKLFLLMLLLCSLIAMLSFFIEGYAFYLLGIPLMVITIIFSFRELDKRIAMTSLIKSKLRIQK